MSTNETEVSAITKYSPWAYDAVFVRSKGVMQRSKERVRTSSHLVLGLLYAAGVAGNLLSRQFQVQPGKIEAILASRTSRVPQGLGAQYRYSDGVRRVFEKSAELAAVYPFIHPVIHTEHVLLALIEVSDEEFSSLMETLGVDVVELRVAVEASLKSKQYAEET